MQHEEQRRPDFEDILAARNRISSQVASTETVRNHEFSKTVGCDALCKCENLQETGSFKLRGATNAILSLREQGITADVATHSSGNHGAALARAATRDGRSAMVVMPHNSVTAKIDSVRRHGGTVVFCEPTHESRAAGLKKLAGKGYIPIPPYDHTDIIAGQGTAALELLYTVPDLDILMAPIGGGGLISGTAIAVRRLSPKTKVLGIEPLGAADTAESFASGHRVSSWEPDTIADGLRALVGEVTFPIIHELVDDVLTVSEIGIVQGMEIVWHTMNMVIEPSSATVVAAMLEHPEVFTGRKVGMIFSGGNIDREKFPQIGNTGGD